MHAALTLASSINISDLSMAERHNKASACISLAAASTSSLYQQAALQQRRCNIFVRD
jgi:hypothetical protein